LSASRRGRTFWRVIALVLVVGALVSLLLTRRPDNALAAPAPRQSPLRTPLWSARRLPALFVRPAEDAHLQKVINFAKGSYNVCVAVDDPSGAVVRFGGNRTLAPASSLKLVTATAALTVLGPDRRLTTRALLAPGGTLTIVGGGDPLLATPQWIAEEHAQSRFASAPYTSLDALAAAIAANGVRSVRGITVDDRRHDSLRFLPAWKPSYATEGEIGALGALTVDDGFATPDRPVPSADPAVTTGQRLATLLARHGVAVSGGVAHGTPAAKAREIAHVDSVPVAQLVEEMLTSSDNYTAEELMREVAVGANGNKPSTTADGIKVAIQALTKLGIAHDGIDIHDGSGLAPTDRVGCPTLLGVVELSSTPRYSAINRGFPVAARTGTLALRFHGDSLAGVLRAKTGSIDGVVALAGVIDSPDHPRFAFIANGDFSDATGAQLQVGVAHLVASFPESINVKALVPSP
jgi:D-alanyl-D-alanine carboxypeptidase/D-alanyl-D-alanine-endopeptidase (penicillin-binding protein 4)